MTEYEQLKKAIEEAPDTWLPALVLVAMKAAIKRKVFKPGELKNLAASTEERYGEKLHGLR
jgi:hypothetical protein